jgi:hypothetical protein
MQEGTYHKADGSVYAPYQTLKYRPVLFRHESTYDLRGSCGSMALATLTGIAPHKVAKALPKRAKYWTDKAISRFLKSKGFKMIPVTVCDVTSHAVTIQNPIKPYHVLLVSQLMLKNEGSWSVVHRNKIYHNFDELTLDPLEFINHPTMTVYAIWHKKWQMRRPQVFSFFELPDPRYDVNIEITSQHKPVRKRGASIRPRSR